MLSGALCCVGKATANAAGTVVSTTVETAGAATVAVVTAGTGAVFGSLFGCCSTVGICECLPLFLLAPCYLPCKYADNAEKIDADATPWCVDCTAYALMMPCGMCCCVAAPKRAILRSALNVDESGVCCIKEDHCVHFCCPCCALLQEEALLDEHKCTKTSPAAQYLNREGMELTPKQENVDPV